MKTRNNYGILSRWWWIPVVAGLLCVCLGIWCLSAPAQSLPVLAYVFAGCLTAAGFANTVMSFSNLRSYEGWGWMLALGLLELICGIWLFCLPAEVLVLTFMYMIGIWILVVAVEGICESCALSVVSPAWVIWTVLLLLVTIGFAIVFLTNPILGAMAEWLYLGIAIIAYGVYRMSFGLRLRRLGRYSGGLL